MSEFRHHSKFRLSAKNPVNQFLVDALVKFRAIADARRLENQSNCYNKIIRSLSKYPLPIVCEDQCLMLEGVGAKMGRILKGLIQDRYRAFLTNPPEIVGDQSIEQAALQIDDGDEAESVRSCSQFQRKREQTQQEELDEAHSLSLIKTHVTVQSQFSKKAPADTQSVSSCGTAGSKYQLRQGSSATFMLRVLYSNNNSEPLTRAQIRLRVQDRFNHPVKVWTFLKKLESTEMIVTEKGEGQERYRLTEAGQQFMRAYEEKQKPCSTAYDQLLKSLEQTSIVSTATKPIEKEYLSQEQLEPYEVLLLIDCREIKDKQSREYFYDKLTNKYGVNCRTQNLSVGDFLWVIDSKPRGTLVLDYIIERKLADDLAASISDGRYKQQKYRLKNSGIDNCYYIFQGKPTTYSVLNERALETAVRRTQLKERFRLIRTQNTLNTLEHLEAMHRSITRTVRTQKVVATCGTLQQFNDVNAKSYLTMNNLLGLMLKSLPNVGRNTTIALTTKFSTFQDLFTKLTLLPPAQRARLVSTLIRSSNRGNHQSIARILVQVCFGHPRPDV